MDIIRDYLNEEDDCDESDNKIKEIIKTEMHDKKPEITTYQCSLCGEKFLSKINLQFHNNFDHKMPFEQVQISGNPGYCSICNRFYKTQMDLETHQIYKHKLVNPLRCSICGHISKDNSQMLEHVDETHYDIFINKYKCLKCSESCSNLQKLEKHLFSHIQLMENTGCKICEKTFRTEFTLQNHISTHTIDKHFFCKFCRKGFDNKTNFRDHLLYHIQNAVEAFPSDDEDAEKYYQPIVHDTAAVTNASAEHSITMSTANIKKEFSVKSLFKFSAKNSVDTYEEDFDEIPSELDVASEDDVAFYAELSHYFPTTASKIKNELFSSDEESDGSNYSTDNDFDFNKNTLPDNLQLKCSKCLRKQNTFSGFNLHIKTHHGDDSINTNKTFYCGLCVKTFKTKLEWKKHCLAVHLHRKQKVVFKCRACDMPFDFTEDRKRHEIDVHVNKETSRFDCTQCDKTFIQAHYLRTHMQFSHNNDEMGLSKHICQECGKIFAKKQYLNNHFRIHQSDQTYECTICSRSFIRKEALVYHLKVTHSEIRRYKCDKCPAAYKESTDLKRHMYSHGGFEKTVECTMCPAKFYDNRGLRVHMKYTHKY